MNLASYIHDVPDFPAPGILFKDLTPLLASPDATAFAAKQLFDNCQDLQIDKVVGIESRGFFFGLLLAQQLGVGFVPIRKPGKLPRDTEQVCYALEYGEDSITVHREDIQPGERVLIHDDVLATGGTAQAASQLIEKLGGEVVQLNFLIELTALQGRSKLQERSITTLLSY
ncbi:adenine phosphoribosyltransferase [Croceiramulus getboli]|nr:adenine phosphoribosyltransferase [Flavobacteriaceae bacterium YJPT1-3]